MTAAQVRHERIAVLRLTGGVGALRKIANADDTPTADRIVRYIGKIRTRLHGSMAEALRAHQDDHAMTGEVVRKAQSRTGKLIALEMLRKPMTAATLLVTFEQALGNIQKARNTFDMHSVMLVRDLEEQTPIIRMIECSKSPEERADMRSRAVIFESGSFKKTRSDVLVAYARRDLARAGRLSEEQVILALQMLQTAASKGNPEARYVLHELAHRDRPAEMPFAQLIYADLLREDGTAAADAEAMRLMYRLAEVHAKTPAGANANYIIGEGRRLGTIAGKPDVEAALRHFRLASRAGNGRAALAAAELLRSSAGTAPASEILEHLKRATDRSAVHDAGGKEQIPFANFLLGKAYTDHELGPCSFDDAERAFRATAKAARENPELVRTLMRRAESGDRDANHVLGLCYSSLAGASDANDNLAVVFFKKAIEERSTPSETRHAPAMVMLAKHIDAHKGTFDAGDGFATALRRSAAELGYSDGAPGRQDVKTAASGRKLPRRRASDSRRQQA